MEFGNGECVGNSVCEVTGGDDEPWKHKDTDVKLKPVVYTGFSNSQVTGV